MVNHRGYERQNANSSDEFYNEARHIIALAVKETRRLKDDHLRTEHILLALTANPESTVAKALSDVGLPSNKLRAAVEFIIGHGDREVEKVKLAPRAKKVMDVALEEAHRYKSNYLGPEHLLLAILLEENSMAFGILDGLVGSKDIDRVRDNIIGKVRGDSEVSEH